MPTKVTARSKPKKSRSPRSAVTVTFVVEPESEDEGQPDMVIGRGDQPNKSQKEFANDIIKSFKPRSSKVELKRQAKRQAPLAATAFAHLPHEVTKILVEMTVTYTPRAAKKLYGILRRKPKNGQKVTTITVGNTTITREMTLDEVKEVMAAMSRKPPT